LAEKTKNADDFAELFVPLPPNVLLNYNQDDEEDATSICIGTADDRWYAGAASH
jgi:hypothetical protein